MHPIITIVVLILATGVYGYILPRWIRQKYYALANICFSLATLFFVKAAGVSWPNLGISLNFSVLLISFLILYATICASFLIIRRRRLKFSKKDYYELFFRIPAGTALAEEILFRGSIMGVLLQNYSYAAALIISSIIFGFWHVLPGPLGSWFHQNMPSNNRPAWVAKTSSAAATVAFTFVGGLAFGWLRLASGSIALPWVAHTLTNALGWIINYSSPRTAKVKGSKKAN